MIWILVNIILVFICIIFGAPFIDYFAPSDSIVLVDTAAGNIIVARGPETLWYQWQNWAYIALFIIALIIVTYLLKDFMQTSTDLTIADRKSKLESEIARYKQLQVTFVDEAYRQAKQKLQSEQDELEQLQTTINKKSFISYENLKKAQDLNRQTNISNRAHHKVVKSQNKQRDRLSAQKKMIVNYLEAQNWHVENEKLTYRRLLELAKKHEHDSH